MDGIKKFAKEVFKGAATTFGLTLAVMATYAALDSLYDYRVVLGILAGKFGFDFLYNNLSKIKGLQ